MFTRSKGKEMYHNQDNTRIVKGRKDITTKITLELSKQYNVMPNCQDMLIKRPLSSYTP
eukprot:c17124_g1_i2 orf=307-483(+)